MPPFRTRSRRLAGAAAAAFLALTGPAATRAQTGAPPSAPAAVQAGLDALVRETGTPGATLLVYRDGRLLYRADAGEIETDAQLPVASASKWMTAVLLLMLVDDGLLALDEPIGRRLPEYTGAAGEITLRQLLSYTAGQGGLPDLIDVRLSPDLSLREAARRIADEPLRDPPGTVFRYGGPSFQVAGALAEQVTGTAWAELFEQRIARPLGLTHTSWGALTRDGVRSGVSNPNLQAGVTTTAEDYGRFLTLIAGDGVVNGRRLLSSESVSVLATASTLGIPMAYTPPGVRGVPIQYALGSWCEIHDASGRCSTVSSPGAYGAYPWIDRDTGVYGIFFLQSRLPRVVAHIRQTREAVREAARLP